MNQDVLDTGEEEKEKEGWGGGEKEPRELRRMEEKLRFTHCPLYLDSIRHVLRSALHSSGNSLDASLRCFFFCILSAILAPGEGEGEGHCGKEGNIT